MVEDEPLGVAALEDTFVAILNDCNDDPARYPRIRTGAREPIPSWLRTAVYQRDGFRCGFCGSGANLVLDHIVPWSAGGGDSTENLRTLCWDCNEQRSNYADPIMETRVPIAGLCVACFERHYGEPWGVFGEADTKCWCFMCRSRSVTCARFAH